MAPLNTITLLFNGLTLALALGFLIIVLWHDYRKELNQFFGIFLFLVTLWNAGSLLLQAALLIDTNLRLSDWAVSTLEVGFTGSSVAAYVLTTILVGAHPRRFRVLAFASLSLILGYQLFLIVNQTGQVFTEISFSYRFSAVSLTFYLIFDGVTLFLVWRYRRKIRSFSLIIGIVIFVIGQSLGFLNPRLQIVTTSTALSSLGALILSFSILRLEIITPLADRISQVESMHQVSLAITSQIALDTVLNEISTQAVGWLDADAACIFLKHQHELELATVYNLPEQFTHTQLALGVGVAGSVAITNRSIHLEQYGRDWTGSPDLPLAKETFGSVICVPLTYANEVIGTLMVISGLQGRLFGREDVYLLELLGAQAAVAIAHSRLFAEQRQLTHEVESARSQLETVLTSTESPVIAVNRNFELIFANPAARKLFNIPDKTDDKLITDLLPVVALPELSRNVLRELRRKKGYIYEISFDNRVYLCHLASLGRPRIAGWVAVLNDVTELKELDRLKSEMVRWASHDLKNPLTGAMLYLDLLMEDLANYDNVEVRQSVSMIEKQLERMNRIIRGILDLERLKAGSTSTEICRPSIVVHNAVEELSQLARDSGLTLETHVERDLGVFWGDPEQFERALINLLENAIKFTSSGGEVEIKAQQEDNKIIFSVKDTGIGIPEHLYAPIFDRFFRGGQKGQEGAEHVSGSGLGLSLVKTIVENHKGEIWVESEVGKGTTFFVSIPLAAELSSIVNNSSHSH
jgi:signal transduction histidine kinase